MIIILPTTSIRAHESGRMSYYIELCLHLKIYKNKIPSNKISFVSESSIFVKRQTRYKFVNLSIPHSIFPTLWCLHIFKKIFVFGYFENYVGLRGILMRFYFCRWILYFLKRFIWVFKIYLFFRLHFNGFQLQQVDFNLKWKKELASSQTHTLQHCLRMLYTMNGNSEH